MNATKEEKTLLYLTARSIAKEPFAFVAEKPNIDGINWETIAKESLAQTVGAAAFDAASIFRDEIPQEIYAKWKAFALRNIATTQHNLHAHAQLNEIANGRAFVTLKGFASSSYYPAPHLRAQGDVDFLVKKEDIAEFEKQLIKAGFEKSTQEYESHLVFKNGDTHYEMHFQVAGLPLGTLGEKARAYLSDAVDTAKIIERDGVQIPVPAPEKHGAILLLHSSHHLLGEGLGLRHLCDWAVFVTATKEETFWTESLLPFFKEMGLFVFAKTLTKTASKYLYTACPTWAEDADESLCDALIRDILQSGNFGRKDGARARSGMILSNHGKEGTKRGFFYNAFQKIHVVTMRVTAVQKCKLLYPFVWGGKTAQYLLRSLTNKRPKVNELWKNAKDRKTVYDRLHIFETNHEEK